MVDETDAPERERTTVPSSAADIRRAEDVGRRRPGNRLGGPPRSRQRGGQVGPGTAGTRRRGDDHGRGRPGYGDTARRRGDDHGRQTPRPSELDDAENEAADLYNDDGSDRGWRRRALKKHWKRAAAGGGVAGLSIGSILLFMSVAQGPLEFVHLTQLLEKFHFSSQEDAQDGRLQAIVRYIHDPSKPQNTRLGIAGNIAADHLESKINESTGLKSEYDPLTGQDKGYGVIRDSEQFKGRSVEEIKTELSTKYGVDPATITTSGGDIHFNPDPGGVNTIKRYRAVTKFSRGLLTQAGYSRISTHVGSRVLGKRAGWTFHPIRKLDASIQNSIVKGGKAGKDQLSKLKDKLTKENATYEAKGDTGRPGGSPSAQQQKDANGNPVANPDGEKAAQEAGDVQSAAQDTNPTDPESTQALSDKLSVKVATGGAAALGVMCLVRNLNSSINQEKFGKIVLPMMRKAGKAFSTGSQTQSGQDIDTIQLGILHDQLDKRNKQGKVVSTWNEARSIQAENGQPLTGPDLPKEDQVFDGNSGSPFAFISAPAIEAALGPACGALESTFGQIFSIVTGPISYVVSGEILKQVMPALAGWLSGSPLSSVAAGADYGNIVNYGALLSANDLYASVGGVVMDAADAVTLKNVNSELDKQDFRSKSIAYRLFNTRDSQTLASHMIDNQDFNVSNDVASLTTGFGNIFKSALTIPATLLSGRTAADQTYDYHGLKKVGFTTSELADKRFENPFKNGCYVVGCHNSKTNITGIFEDPDKAQKYTDRAKKCFNIDITHDGNNWNINSLTEAVNFNSGDYPSECKDKSEDWLRVRFWLLDTPTMEGYTCSQGLDDQSCKDLGLDDSGSGGPSEASGTTAATGNAQQLAQQILANNKITYECGSSAQEDIKDAAAGKPGTAGVPISSEILQLIATIGENHSVCVSSLESHGQGHTTGSYHYTGDAVDFGRLDGVYVSGRNAPSLTIIQIAYKVLPKGSALGQSGCGTTPQAPPGWDPPFDDSCDHLHVQVPRGTP